MSEPRDAYADLDAHLIQVKALHCEDGCGAIEASHYWSTNDAARQLAARGWVVRPFSAGDDALTALCKDCAAWRDAEKGATQEA